MESISECTLKDPSDIRLLMQLKKKNSFFISFFYLQKPLGFKKKKKKKKKSKSIFLNTHLKEITR